MKLGRQVQISGLVPRTTARDFRKACKDTRVRPSAVIRALVLAWLRDRQGNAGTP